VTALDFRQKHLEFRHLQGAPEAKALSSCAHTRRASSARFGNFAGGGRTKRFAQIQNAECFGPVRFGFLLPHFARMNAGQKCLDLSVKMVSKRFWRLLAEVRSGVLVSSFMVSPRAGDSSYEPPAHGQRDRVPK
jgi:hypothetical protein